MLRTCMTSLKLIAIFIISSSSVYSIIADDNILKARPGTPLFEKPDNLSKAVKVIGQERDFEIIEKQSVFLSKNPVFPWIEYHPLTLYVDFFKIKEGSEEFWLSPSFVYYEKTKTPICIPIPRISYKFLGFIFFAIAFSAGYSAILLTYLRKSPFSEYSSSLWLIFVITLKSSFLAFIIFNAGNVVIRPSDELGYFKIGYDLVHAAISKWHYTIGHGIVMIPFIIFKNANSYYEISHAISFFNAFVVNPACLVLLYLIFQKIGLGILKTLTIIFIFAFLPFFLHPAEGHGSHRFGMIMGMPDCFAGSYSLYNLFIATGFSGLSDTVSMFFILLCISLCLYMKKKTYAFVIIPAIFSFACLVRINNIFFAPLIVYLLLRTLENDNVNVKASIKYMSVSCCVFLFVFMPQLILNEHLYGAFYRFAYSLHGNRSSEGFAIDKLVTGIPYLFNCNFVYVSLFSVSILFINKRELRLMLILWAVPLLLFFCGYPVIIASPIRFIESTYPAMIAAYVASFPENFMGSPKRTVIFSAFCLLVFLTLPSSLASYSYYFIYDWLSYIIYAFFAVLLLWTLIDLVFRFRKYFLKDIVDYRIQDTRNSDKC